MKAILDPGSNVFLTLRDIRGVNPGEIYDAEVDTDELIDIFGIDSPTVFKLLLPNGHIFCFRKDFILFEQVNPYRKLDPRLG